MSLEETWWAILLQLNSQWVTVEAEVWTKELSQPQTISGSLAHPLLTYKPGVRSLNRNSFCWQKCWLCFKNVAHDSLKKSFLASLLVIYVLENHSKKNRLEPIFCKSTTLLQSGPWTGPGCGLNRSMHHHVYKAVHCRLLDLPPWMELLLKKMSTMSNAARPHRQHRPTSDETAEARIFVSLRRVCRETNGR